jgi:hypothetical protein
VYPAASVKDLSTAYCLQSIISLTPPMTICPVCHPSLRSGQAHTLSRTGLLRGNLLWFDCDTDQDTFGNDTYVPSNHDAVGSEVDGKRAPSGSGLVDTLIKLSDSATSHPTDPTYDRYPSSKYITASNPSSSSASVQSTRSTVSPTRTPPSEPATTKSGSLLGHIRLPDVNISGQPPEERQVEKLDNTPGKPARGGEWFDWLTASQ